MNTKKFLKILSEKKIDAVISESFQFRLWSSEVFSSDGFCIMNGKKNYVFLDSRYLEYGLKKTENNANVEILTLSFVNIKKVVEDLKITNLGFEADYLTVKNLTNLQKLLPKINFKPISGQELRIIKTSAEIAKIQKAVDISLCAFEKVKKALKVGMSETEVDHLLNYEMKKCGADKEAFDNIIAFGSSTSEPHHHPLKEKKLSEGDIVTFDFGAVYQGYMADITRTFFFGEPKNEKLVQILDVVKKAAAEGRKAVKPGIKASEIDLVCREFIKKAGYLTYFKHSTGHGLGIDIHELPNVGKDSEIILEPGMVITVEPGIYIDGLGGARIEDDLVVTETGHKVLSRKIENWNS